MTIFSPALSGKNLLVVSPGTDLRASLAFALRAEGYSVTEAASWSADMRALFDLVVLDEAAMPRQHGPVGAGVPIVVLTSRASAALPAWAAAAVEKPSLGPLLVTAIEGALAKGHGTPPRNITSRAP